MLSVRPPKGVYPYTMDFDLPLAIGDEFLRSDSALFVPEDWFHALSKYRVSTARSFIVFLQDEVQRVAQDLSVSPYNVEIIRAHLQSLLPEITGTLPDTPAPPRAMGARMSTIPPGLGPCERYKLTEPRTMGFVTGDVEYPVGSSVVFNSQTVWVKTPGQPYEESTTEPATVLEWVATGALEES